MLGSGFGSCQFCAGAKDVPRSAPIMGLYGGEHEANFSTAGLRLARRLHIDRPAQADGAFPGLVDFAATAPGHSVDVLLVHGMCTHEVLWADETVTKVRCSRWPTSRCRAWQQPPCVRRTTCTQSCSSAVQASCRAAGVNVLVSNAPTWLGLLERPDHAHTNYLLNPDVARMVACGEPRSARCE